MSFFFLTSSGPAGSEVRTGEGDEDPFDGHPYSLVAIFHLHIISLVHTSHHVYLSVRFIAVATGTTVVLVHDQSERQHR